MAKDACFVSVLDGRPGRTLLQPGPLAEGTWKRRGEVEGVRLSEHEFAAWPHLPGAEPSCTSMSGTGGQRAVGCLHSPGPSPEPQPPRWRHSQPVGRDKAGKVLRIRIREAQLR